MTDSANTIKIRLLLRAKYGLVPNVILKTVETSFNTHYILELRDAHALHVTVYSLGETTPVWERLEQVRYAHSIISNLLASGCDCVLPFRDTIDKMDLASEGDVIIDVRSHIVTRPEAVTPYRFGCVLKKLHSHLSLLPRNERPGAGTLRFNNCDKLVGELSAATKWIKAHTGPDEGVLLDEYVSEIEKWWDENSKRFSLYIPTHGDYDMSNVLVAANGKEYIVDFDCAYLDVVEADVAHGMLSAACGRKFREAWNDEAAKEFSRGYFGRRFSFTDIKVFCKLMILKKMLLVKNPKNLFITERLCILRRLSNIY